MPGFFHNRNRPRGVGKGRKQPNLSERSPGRANGGAGGRSSARQDWREYDAEAFERGAVPLTSAAAADLVALAAPEPGQRLLDVGTGTGVAAQAASHAVGAGGIVVGADLSVDMLGVGARKRPGARYVAADAIDLPFRGQAFDVVTANFLIALVPKYDTVLFDMIRVLKPGGHLALSWWGKGQDEFQRTWRELAEEAVGQELLDDAIKGVMPWNDRFADRHSFEETLRDAGLHPVRVEAREYRVQMALEDYLVHRATSAAGRFIRNMLGEEGWNRFLARARAVYAERFPAQINDFRDVLLAVGTRASDGLQQQDVQGSTRR
ncbi:MAG: class I SAM-dependent methyltransferase [Actinomycetota bacterium]